MSDYTAEQGKKLRYPNGKPDGFIKRKQKDWLLSELVNMVIIFMGFVWKVTGFYVCFPDRGKPSSSSWL